MQKFYPYKVLEEEAQASDNTTFLQKLPSEGQATALDIELKATNGGTSNVNNLLVENISEIELVGDGTDKILSLPGYVLWKYLWAIQGRPPVGSYTEWLNETQWMQLKIPFGRYVGDQEYMLNLDKYREVVLAIKYNLATKNNVGASGFLTGTFGLKIDLMKTLPGVKLPSKGCRRVVERKSWVTAASGEEEWPFVQDYPYTAVMAWCKGTDRGGQWFTDMKLDMGGGKPILIDRTFEMVQLRNIREMGIDPTYTGKYMAANAEYIYTHGGGVAHCNPTWVMQHAPALDAFKRVTPARLGGEYVQLAVASIATAGDATEETAVQLINATTRHYTLGELVYIPLCDYPSWNNPVLPADVKEAILKMTQSGASAAGRVITEQILPQ